MELHSCRPVGFGPGPIPWTAIHQWSEANSLDEEQTEDIFVFVRAMDNAYLSYEAKKSKSASKGKK